MARVTHVKAAQQRYATVPVLDEDGNPKRTTLHSKSTGQPKTTKTGKVVTIAVTREDRNQPLPPRTCGACGEPIQVGQPYKWIQPKSGPYGGSRMNRHAACPDWNIWDYSNSTDARVAQLQHDAAETIEGLSDVETPEDVTAAASEIAEAIKEFAQEKSEAADNLEEGFGHETSQSAEIREVAEQLESWADEIEQVDVEDLPEPDQVECEDCGGTGEDETVEVAEGEEAPLCEGCDGTGEVQADEPTEDQINEWREAVITALQEAVDNCPL